MAMPLSVCRLRRSLSFRRLTGVSIAPFDEMLTQLRGPWAAAARRKAKSGRPWEVGGLEDHLLVMLLYYRCYVTQEFIGFFYQVDRSVICRAIKRIEAHTKPLFAVRRQPRISRAEAEALIVDCTEQPIQRPGCNARQEAYYSGKKKRHTLKTEYTVTAQGRIASVSPSHPGSRHDLRIRRDGPSLPGHARAYADSAYQGYEGASQPGHPLQEIEEAGPDHGGEGLSPWSQRFPGRRRTSDRADQAIQDRLRSVPQPA